MILIEIGQRTLVGEAMIKLAISFTAPLIQAPIGCKIGDDRRHTSLVVLQMVNLLGKTVDEPVSKIIESIIFKF